MAWFEVSKNGLKELQENKPRWRLIGELIQNAFDEPITYCKVYLDHCDGCMTIKVEDDSPIGFRDLKDVYTLFGHTYKRENPEKRGRFNLGEKMIFSICSSAKVVSTKGAIIFNENGRKETSDKIKRGSIIQLKIPAKEEELPNTINYLKKFIPPDKILFEINKCTIPPRKALKEFRAPLQTEYYSNGVMRRVTRETTVAVYSSMSDSWLYEMGIPIQRTPCKYDLNIQQRIPLSLDRETVLPSFLQTLFSEVLNEMIEAIDSNESSELWIRDALSDSHIKDTTIKEIVRKRWGDKVCVRSPRDLRSVDEAITRGYKVVGGSELSKREWMRIREAKAIPSSSELFGGSFAETEIVSEDKWTKDQRMVVTYAKMIARETLGKEINVQLIRSKANTVAMYDPSKGLLSFNCSRIAKEWWKSRVSEEVTDLILHELGHEGGWHWENGYHKMLTKIAAKLVMLALKKPELFKLIKEDEI